MTGWLVSLVGLVAWGIAMAVLAPRVGRALRRSRLSLDATPGELRSFTDATNSTWDERPDHLFDMRDTEDGLYQGWTHSQIDRVHGPLTRTAHPEQDPTT